MKLETFVSRMKKLSKDYKLPYTTEERNNRYTVHILKGNNVTIETIWWDEAKTDGTTLSIIVHSENTKYGCKSWKDLRSAFLKFELGIQIWS